MFDQVGTNNRIKIRAEIQQFVGGGVYKTIGEAEQKEVSVVPPKFKWAFEPEKGKGRVGREVKVTITTDPRIKDELINYEWSYPESSNRMEYEKNARVIGFVPKDGKPFKLLVAPKTAANRDPVGGGLLEEYQVAPYTVTITEPHYAASRPRIWKCDTQLGGAQKCGIVEVSDQLAVHHNIYVEALISPELPKGDLRYRWTVQPSGSCGLPGSGDQLTMNCSDTGTFNVSVEIKDANGVLLGSASRSVSITISEKTLKESEKKIKETEKARNDIARALELLHQGKIDEAIELAEEASRADPKSPPLRQFAQEAKKLGWDAVYERDFEPGLNLLKTAAKLSPDDMDAKEKFEKATRFKKIWPQVERKAEEFANLIAEKKVVTAYKKILEIQDLQHDMPGTMANKFSQNIMNTWHKANEEYNQFIQEALKRHTEYFNAMDWDGMLAHAQDVLKREHTEAEKKNWESNVSFAKQKISERNQACQYYQSVKSIFEKGDQTQAYGMLGELNTKPQYFMKSDPRRQQILDLIAALEKMAQDNVCQRLRY
ncbi:MAG TPA: hypothetical protein VK435_10325, partial [Thermodesulfovibrionales bacterium]|nr:hypothetical protein [Thermodesulfovibrionales bacterium]